MFRKLIMKYVTLVECSVLCLLLQTLFVLAQEPAADTFYCKNNEVYDISEARSGRIITRKEGTIHYGNNLHCTWVISVGAPAGDEVVHLSISSTHLQWAPVNAICVGYDYVTVYDGGSGDQRSDELVVWCGERNPRSITSTGSTIRIEFKSNDRNQYNQRGVELHFEIFERKLTEGSCPTGWFDDPVLPDGGLSCYTVKQHLETWMQAQAYCAYDQANLVTMETEEEEKFLADFVQQSDSVGEYDKVWISLNDIAVDGEYRWLDGTKTSFTQWEESLHLAESYFNCIQMNKAGLWQEDFCNENDIQSVTKHKFLCEKPKVGETVSYTIPSERIAKGGKTTIDVHRNWMILGILAGCVAVTIVLIVVLVCYCQKKKKKKQTPSRSSRYNAEARQPMARQGSVDTDTQVNTRPPATAPSAPPAESQPQPQTIVVMMQQPNHPSEPPPSYSESQSQKTSAM